MPTRGPSPTKKTLAMLRQSGAIAEVVERWVYFGRPEPGKAARGVRKDLFGFVDIVALVPDGDRFKVVGIQACVGGDASKRIDKIALQCREAACALLRAGAAIQVWAWRDLAKDEGGGRRSVPRVIEVTLETIASHREAQGGV